MNFEEPTQQTRPQQFTTINSNPVAPTNQDDTPMDEFEYTGKGAKVNAKNVLKFAKTGGILLAVILVLGLGAVGIMKYMASRQVVQVVQTPSPKPSIPATPKPQIVYPTEYETVQKDIDTYDKTVNSVPDDRSRIEVPQFKFGIAF